MNRLTKANFYLKTFGLFKIPMIFFVNPKILNLTEKEIRVGIDLNWRTKNHYKSMYFGALAIGADVSTGIFALHLMKKRGVELDLLFKTFSIEFFKRPEGRTVFTCIDHKKITDQISEVIHSQQRVNQEVSGFAVTPAISTDPVCRYTMTLSLKQKSY